MTVTTTAHTVFSTETGVCPLHPLGRLVPVVTGRDWFWGLSDVDWAYGACTDCGTWVLSPRPTPSSLGPHYAGYYDDRQLRRWKALLARRGPRALVRSRLHAGDIEETVIAAGLPWPTSPRVLDVGCGLGMFLASARDVWATNNVRGVDFNPVCREFAHAEFGIDVDCGELHGQGYKDGSFDVVTMRHCLEHVRDPRAELQEIHRITTDGGFVEIEVPTPGVAARLFGGRWVFLQPPTHFFHFSEAALVRILDEAAAVANGRDRRERVAGPRRQRSGPEGGVSRKAPPADRGGARAPGSARSGPDPGAGGHVVIRDSSRAGAQTGALMKCPHAPSGSVERSPPFVPSRRIIQ